MSYISSRHRFSILFPRKDFLQLISQRWERHQGNKIRKNIFKSFFLSFFDDFLCKWNLFPDNIIVPTSIMMCLLPEEIGRSSSYFLFNQYRTLINYPLFCWILLKLIVFRNLSKYVLLNCFYFNYTAVISLALNKVTSLFNSFAKKLG